MFTAFSLRAQGGQLALPPGQGLNPYMLAGQQSAALSARKQASAQDTVTSANHWAPQRQVCPIERAQSFCPVTSAQPGASTQWKLKAVCPAQPTPSAADCRQARQQE